ncbi:MAG: CopG family transcriptional regulator [Akkermansiaceae bacterium]|nr:CopG family transcriptional regulator [Akkermansiaceae bacterium]
MRDASAMRTTLNLDDDVLESAKMLAARERKPLGMVISGLLRRAVEPMAEAQMERNGIPLFPVSLEARAVTAEKIKEILDETP